MRGLSILVVIAGLSCSSGGGGMPPDVVEGSLSGTVAVEGPVASAMVTIRGAGGGTREGTTDTSGTFEIDVTGLANLK